MRQFNRPQPPSSFFSTAKRTSTLVEQPLIYGTFQAYLRRFILTCPSSLTLADRFTYRLTFIATQKPSIPRPVTQRRQGRRLRHRHQTRSRSLPPPRNLSPSVFLLISTLILPKLALHLPRSPSPRLGHQIRNRQSLRRRRSRPRLRVARRHSSDDEAGRCAEVGCDVRDA